MKHLPKALIISRFFIGLIILVLSLCQVAYFNIYAVILFAIGLLTDIFDGIIARRLNISTENLRRLDSTTDQVFFILIAIATYINSSAFYKDNMLQLSILLLAELATYIVCYIKFRKEVATHAISSKIWTLILFATLIQVILTKDSSVLFQFCFYVGILTRLEIIAILLILKKWTNDVPSIFQAIMLRKGKKIKRHKLFNG